MFDSFIIKPTEIKIIQIQRYVFKYVDKLFGVQRIEIDMRDFILKSYEF